MKLLTAYISDWSMQSLLDTLYTLPNGHDYDFTGDNGDKYLRDEALEEGFKSNNDYVYSKAKELCLQSGSTYKDIVGFYLSKWLGSDCYYTDYKYELVYDNNNQLVCIVVAYNTDSCTNDR